MKYVILKMDVGGVTMAMPFVFSNKLVHKDCAKHFQMLIFRQMDFASEVHSAGEFNVVDGEAVCVRGSETLGIPREHTVSKEDSRLIEYNDSMSVMF